MQFFLCSTENTGRAVSFSYHLAVANVVANVLALVVVFILCFLVVACCSCNSQPVHQKVEKKKERERAISESIAWCWSVGRPIGLNVSTAEKKNCSIQLSYFRFDSEYKRTQREARANRKGR